MNPYDELVAALRVIVAEAYVDYENGVLDLSGHRPEVFAAMLVLKRHVRPCPPHHWVLGDLTGRVVEPDPADRWGRGGGALRYRAARCRRCGADAELPERDAPHVSRLEREDL